MVGTPHPEIREARLPADGEAIVGLYRETIQWHAGHWPTDIRSIDDAFVRSTLPELSNLDENTFFRVAEYAGALVGLISANVNPPPAGGMNRYDGPVVWVGDVVVTESARRQGIGGRLMAAVETWARSRGACSITLGVHAGNDPALGLYERNGYRTTERRLRKDL